MKQEQELQMILAQASAEPIGLLLQVSDFNRARAALYQARAKATVQGHDFSQLQFRASPGLEGGNLIIINQRIQLPAIQGDPQP